MIIKTMPLDQLIHAEYNPRVALQPGDPEFEKLKKSILEFGYVDPIVYNERSGVVVGGNQRLHVLRALGFTKVEVSVVDLSPEKEKALNLALNKIGGQWDMAKLTDLLDELNNDEFDIEITGFDKMEICELIQQFRGGNVEEDDFDPTAAAAAIKKPITKLGDIWQLGCHRLMCGDTTNLDDMMKLMDGQRATMVITDPPYNVNYTGSTNEHLTILNDNMPAVKFNVFLRDAFSVINAVTEPGGAIYVCHADSEGTNFREALQSSGWLMKQCLIWVKSQFVIGRQDYHWQHEPILYGWKPGAAHRWHGGRRQSTVIEDVVPMSIADGPDGKIITFHSGVNAVVIRVPSFEVLHTGADDITTVWRFEKPLRNGEHPTMKPVALCARAIRNSSKQGENVGDFFGGSGSTLIAAEQVGRCAYLMELDPIYCDVIVRRWEEYTGQKAVRAK